MRVELPIRDGAGAPFTFAGTDGLHRRLHLVDRQAGTQAVDLEPGLATPAVRDRYLVRSLIEEAITSSQLEGASTTRKVAKQMLLEGRRPATRDERMIANNFEAMQFVRERLEEPLTQAFLFELHQILCRDTLESDAVGRLRRRDEAVTVEDRASGTTLHIPPPADELPARLDALFRFANAAATEGPFIHPVVRAMVLHFALAYEHPFVDGNGRTARALFYWSMLRQRYWLTEFLSISRVIKHAPAQYGRAFLFTESDAGDVTYFLLHQLDVLERAVADLFAWLERKTREVRATERMIHSADRFNHRQRALLSHALRHPGARYTIQGHGRAHRVVYQTARTDLLGLAEAGVLVRKQVGRAYVFDVAPNLEKKLAK